MDLDLEGKVAIVTGGSGGIGRGLVRRLAAEGCRVVVATRDEVVRPSSKTTLKGDPQHLR